MSNKTDTLKFYEVDGNYIQFLKQFESKIPNFNYNQNNKFVCGIVLSINNCNYYVPISSNTTVMKSSLPIYDKSKIISTLKFSFMFPIPDGCCWIKDFSKVNMPYRRLLQKELKYCNSKREDIKKKAMSIHKSVVTKSNPVMVANCCDFKLLEQKCQEYINLLVQAQQPILPNQITLSQNEGLTQNT